MVLSFFTTIFEYLTSFVTTSVETAVDIYDYYYVWWVVAPIFFTVILPLLVLLIFYVDIVIVFIYTWHFGAIRTAYGISLRNGAFQLIAAIWDVHSRLWHGYEVIGMDNIPKEEPALLLFYHGAIPVDHYYLMAKVWLQKSRLICTIGDNFLYKLPGFPVMAKALNIIPGSVQECANILKEGGLVAIYPGGVYESQFGDANYQLLWRNRLGFAKVALEAKVPIIPVFTQNIREAFISMPVWRSLWLKLYAWTRLPLTPVIGEFPVKLRTIIGEPIPYEAITPEELKLKVANILNNMILKHQRLPGSVFQALCDRFRSFEDKST